MHSTLEFLRPSTFPSITRKKLQTLQINIGLKCNQQCVHCHVNSSPKRTEAMDETTVESVINFLKKGDVTTLDITGGAPELHPRFRYLVEKATDLGLKVIDRCNLTILFEKGQENLADFLAAMKVEITASLPCYQPENVDRQRGEGVFEKSINALKLLNAREYGMPDSGLILNLVYNPQGPSLPPPQEQLESDFKIKLKQEHGIEFNELYNICNMPIQRFGSTLISSGKFNEYIELLRNSHSDANLENVMCKTMISVDWQGYVYDCDFNQMLNLPMHFNNKNKLHISDLANRDITDNPIITCNHCYGCTAGQGSSCGGALNQ